jgi:hypothetical protein
MSQESEGGVEQQQAALGGAFYRASAAEHREHLQLREDELAARGAISEATGIDDPDFLAELTGLGIRVDSLAALTLIPLIAVAWSDGEMDESERAAVLDAAVETGIRRNSVSYHLLEIWMIDPPPPDLTNVWHDFIRALRKQLKADEHKQIESKLLGRARAVAQAAGDALNRTPHISTSEEACLTKLSQAFS